MKKGIFFLSITILLFITQTITGLAPGVVAVSIGIFLVLVSKIDIEVVAYTASAKEAIEKVDGKVSILVRNNKENSESVSASS